MYVPDCDGADGYGYWENGRLGAFEALAVVFDVGRETDRLSRDYARDFSAFARQRIFQRYVLALRRLRSVYADGLEYHRYSRGVRKRYDGCSRACARFAFVCRGDDTLNVHDFAKFDIVTESLRKNRSVFRSRNFHGGKFRIVALESKKALTKKRNSYKIYSDIL